MEHLHQEDYSETHAEKMLDNVRKYCQFHKSTLERKVEQLKVSRALSDLLDPALKNNSNVSSLYKLLKIQKDKPNTKVKEKLKSHKIETVRSLINCFSSLSNLQKEKNTTSSQLEKTPENTDLKNDALKKALQENLRKRKEVKETRH